MAKNVKFGDVGSETRVSVSCLAGDQVGRLMCIRGEKVDSKWVVETANPYDLSKMPAVGILISKSSSTTGIMIRIGDVENQYTGLDVSKPVFVGAAGAVVQAEPSASGGIVRVQKIGFPIDSDVLHLTGGTPQTITRRP